MLYYIILYYIILYYIIYIIIIIIYMQLYEDVMDIILNCVGVQIDLTHGASWSVWASNEKNRWSPPGPIAGKKRLDLESD